MSPYYSRKFILACVSLTIGTVALFTRFLDGTQWITLVAWVLGVHAAGQITDEKLNGTYERRFSAPVGKTK